MIAKQLLRRTGVVFRRTLLRERIPITWGALTRIYRRMELRGGSLQLNATAFGENGQAVPGVTFAWSSGAASVAAVDSSAGISRPQFFGVGRV